MNLHDIIIGLTIAYILYQLMETLIPKRTLGDTPWSSTETSLVHENQPRPFQGLGKKLGFQQWLTRNERYRQRLDLLLIRSGHPFQWTVEDLLFFKLAFIAVAAALLWAYSIDNLLVWVVGLFGGFQFLDFYLTLKAQARSAEISQRLPGFIDLLTLTIEGGLDLIAALERIMEKMKAGPLHEELLMICQEIRLGTPRKEALEHWVFRTNISDIQSLTSMIIQSEELGTSLATVLRSYSEDMRTRRITRAEEIAGKAPVKLLFPMVVFFFPIVFVIIFGPVAMTVMSATAGK